jgi:hypothetical protein
MAGICGTYDGRELHIGFWLENLKECARRPRIDGMIMLKWILQKHDWKVRSA